MAKKKKNTNNNNGGNDNTNNKTDSDKKDKGGDGENNSGKDDYAAATTTTVVMKIEMYCEGCASKITKLARALQGVESAKAETDTNKLTVIGKLDPLQIQQSLQHKTKKKVDLISPQLKKQEPNKTNNKNSTEKPPQSAKPKEAPVTTTVLKLESHCFCQGCIEKIHKIVIKTKGVQEVAMDKQKETVTVKGTMDVKALTAVLSERLKISVSIVPPKKEKDDGAKEGGNDGGGGGGKKRNGGGGGGGGDPPKMDGNRMDFVAQPGYGPGYGYMGHPVYGNGYAGQPVHLAHGYMGQPAYGYGYGYGYGPVPGYPAHMKFNDENPNACSIL